METITEQPTQTETISPWVFRFATEADASTLAKFVAENRLIDPKDIPNGTRAAQPSVTWFVAEHEGTIVAAAPVYLAAVIAHLVLNPDSPSEERKQALNFLLDGAMALYVQGNIRHIMTLSKSDYGVAKFAVAHDFVKDDRELFVLDLNPILEQGNKENLAAEQTAQKAKVN